MASDFNICISLFRKPKELEQSVVLQRPHGLRLHGLDAQVDGGDGEQRLLALLLAARLDGVGLLGADLVVQAQPLHLRGGLDLVEQIVDGAQTAVGVLQGLT